MQQYLPLAVLKRLIPNTFAVVLGVATVLTACGIETFQCIQCHNLFDDSVATVLTACGIETLELICNGCLKLWLQQYLPLAVLKHISDENMPGI